MSPLIGVSSCRALTDYLESIRRVGGDPRVLDAATDCAADALRALDGLVLTGGADIDPARYGQPRDARVRDASPERDAFEIEVTTRALELDLPILAICRGIQVLNVACGGALIQDIPSEVPGALGHQVDEPRFAIAHEVWIARGTKLWSLMIDSVPEREEAAREAAEVLSELARESENEALEDVKEAVRKSSTRDEISFGVNSRHHQAVGRVAEGFEVAATAPDGVIEAIERPASRFCLGVQWHPENFWRTGEFRPLFEGFLAACQKQ